MEVLFKTQHGSKLYGLDHAGSDDDWFVVVAKKGVTTAHTRKRYARQSIIDGVDSTVVDFSTWLAGCFKGVPQFLEAMFSQMPEVDRIPDFRNNFRATHTSYETYLRTMKSFAMSDTLKSKRHAIRLGRNMRDIREFGRFNPTMRPEDARAMTVLAEDLTAESTYEFAKMLAWC